ncbi:juvenile hormone esterase-like [Haematobia irritans]|uniref:juvenile hormone esterase-like n=1 Tax=Haematobia irritans TaxID=7368 RepID=UPI003F4FD5AE
MWRKYFIMALMPFLYFQAVRATSPPLVCPRDVGCIRGTFMPGYRIESFEAFMGIPFALPPLGELRFKHPQPYPKWPGTLNATQHRDDCIQKNDILPNPQISGVEDCLYLNVYRPKQTSKNSKLPVMVYIYGGGWLSGTHNPSLLGPEYFMDTQEVVLVTISYRVGIFGFLSTNDSIIPGNFGMKDQTLALKWVQRHIAAFGGDPKQVTIFGQSAGGGSTHMHMLSKHSEGLFQAVISISGLATLPLAIQPDPLKVARATAEQCNVTNAHNISSTKLLAALQSMDIERLFAAGDKLKYWEHHPLTLYSPVVENFDSPNAFLTRHPNDIIAKGDYKPTRFMTGIVPDDGAVLSIAIWDDERKRISFNNDFDHLLELALQFPSHLNRSRLDWAMEKIANEYFDGRHELSKQGILDVYTDRMFAHPMYDVAKTFVQTIDTKKYPLNLYIFNYTGPYTYTPIFSGNMPNTDYGVVHCDELIYLFRMPAVFPDFPKTSTEAKMSQTLVENFVNFAANRYSGPECIRANFPTNSEDSICSYVSYQNGPSNAFVVKTDNKFNVRRMRMWDEILQY